MDQARALAAAVDEARQWDRLMALARIGAIAGDGVNRQALTALDREARRLVIGWAEAAGADVSVDAAANLWLRKEGADPAAAPMLTGSHMDSQPEGGRFDGIYGVVAGLEVLSALHDSGIVLERSLEVVAWTNEEGSRFAPGCMGSMAWSGRRPLASFAEITDADGVRFGDALAKHLAAEIDLARRALGGQPHAYIEAHIEQGPRLEAEGLDIGVVTGIQGSRWFAVTITGASAHAGTTPVSLRRDALQAAVRAINALNGLMADPSDRLRFTIGSLTVEPGSSNSVAGAGPLHHRSASPGPRRAHGTGRCHRGGHPRRRGTGGGCLGHRNLQCPATRLRPCGHRQHRGGGGGPGIALGTDAVRRFSRCTTGREGRAHGDDLRPQSCGHQPQSRRVHHGASTRSRNAGACGSAGRSSKRR